jgi:hypothetical protein
VQQAEVANLDSPLYRNVLGFQSPLLTSEAAITNQIYNISSLSNDLRIL